MSLFITSLNSGSSGNCYYVGNEHEAILVDVGISCREVEKRLSRLGLKIQNVKAIFISHEHSDHIKGLEVLSRKYKLQVYITPATLRSGKLQLQEELVLDFKAYQTVSIGSLSVTAFPKFHDAADPHSFIVHSDNITVGVLTDIGSVCRHVIENFRQCQAVFLEANYDETMLEEGNYPFFLKRRIQGTHGHLSNTQALELFLNHASGSLTHLVLSHLSRDNNSPQLVKNLFEKHAQKVKIVVASRDYETDVYRITENSVAEEMTAVPETTDQPGINMPAPFPVLAQMSLF